MKYGSKGKLVEKLGDVLFSTCFKENTKGNGTEEIRRLQIKNVIQEKIRSRYCGIRASWHIVHLA
jgi:hypothetical protein